MIIMKVIPLSEAKAHLSQYGRLCHQEPVIVTVNGSPSFQLVPLEDEDDLIDRLLEHHPGFRRTMAERLREPSVPARSAETPVIPMHASRNIEAELSLESATTAGWRATTSGSTGARRSEN